MPVVLGFFAQTLMHLSFTGLIQIFLTQNRDNDIINISYGMFVILSNYGIVAGLIFVSIKVWIKYILPLEKK